MRTHLRRAFVPILMIIAGAAVAFMGFGEAWVHSIAGGILFGLALLLLILVVQYFLFLPRGSARVFRESAYLHGAQTISFDESGFAVEGPSGTVGHQWSTIAKWDESSKLMAVYPNRLIAYILPKEKLSPQLIDHVRSQLVGSGLARKGELRK